MVIEETKPIVLWYMFDCTKWREAQASSWQQCYWFPEESLLGSAATLAGYISLKRHFGGMSALTEGIVWNPEDLFYCCICARAYIYKSTCEWWNTPQIMFVAFVPIRAAVSKGRERFLEHTHTHTHADQLFTAGQKWLSDFHTAVVRPMRAQPSRWKTRSPWRLECVWLSEKTVLYCKN